MFIGIKHQSRYNIIASKYYICFDLSQQGVTKSIDEGWAEDIVHMDFSKTFHNIRHGRLVWKLKTHGIQVNLGVRSQRVVVGSCYSARAYNQWHATGIGARFTVVCPLYLQFG